MEGECEVRKVKVEIVGKEGGREGTQLRFRIYGCHPCVEVK